MQWLRTRNLHLTITTINSFLITASAARTSKFPDCEKTVCCKLVDKFRVYFCALC
jgi:hypothetical protein